ncbi:MAG: DUF2635 domain-containing protein [Burkholderiaceae bacterium]
MYVIPASGMLVPDPAHPRSSPLYFLPAAGREVEASDYWHRRVRDGDVTVAAMPPKPAAPPPAAASGA